MFLFYLALATFYITFLMVEATILDAPRQRLALSSMFLLKLLSCEKCSALWAGIFCTILYVIHPWLLYPLAGAGAVLLLWPVWKRLLNVNT